MAEEDPGEGGLERLRSGPAPYLLYALVALVSFPTLGLITGGRDALVLPARTAALLERLCGVGQVVETLEVPDGDHDTVTGLATDDISAWVADRFAGDAPVDDC